jgi:AhpD family alkylhydroperoxidase
MKTRLNYFQYIGGGASHLLALTRYTRNTSLDSSLIHLVQIRVSQINHCAFCLDMHILEARLDEIEDRKLHAVATWRDSPLFSDKEKAALEWAEAVTLLSQNDVSDTLYEETLKHFTEAELSYLTLVISVINAWNRLSVSFKTLPGSYDKQVIENHKRKKLAMAQNA